METSIKNKRHLASTVSSKSGVSKIEVSKVLEALSETVKETLQSDGEIVLPGGVKVFMKKRSAIETRESKHPRTGEPMTIERTPARKVVKATAMQSLKNSVESDLD